MAAKSREIVRNGVPRIFPGVGQPGTAGPVQVFGATNPLGPKIDPTPNVIMVQNPTDVDATFVIEYSEGGSAWANPTSATVKAGGVLPSVILRPNVATRLSVTAGLYCVVDTLQHAVGNGLA